jgi:hypothetical protein
MSEWRPAGGSAARTLVLASVRVSEVVFSPSLILPPHEHEKNTLAITLGGEYQASSRSADVLGPARISVEPCGLRHSCQFGPHGARVLVIQPLQELEGTCRRLFTEGRVLQDRSIASVAWRIGTELKANDASTPLIVEGLTLEILGASTRAVTRKETSVRHHDGVTRAEQMVRSCLHGPLRMQDVASARATECRSARTIAGCASCGRRTGSPPPTRACSTWPWTPASRTKATSPASSFARTA